jgi:hypothetical protein
MADCSDKGYGEDFVKQLSKVGIKDPQLMNTRGEYTRNTLTGKIQYFGDVSFTVGDYANKPYYKLYKESKNPIMSESGLPYPGTTMPDPVDRRIRTAIGNIRKDL